MKIISDIILLQFAKVIELVIPILIIPVVIGNIGLSDFGLITKSIIISSYLVMIGEWGFNTNLVNYFNQKKDVCKLFNVFLDLIKARLIFLFFLFFLAFILVGLRGGEAKFVLITIVWIASNVFQCRWYFQATNKLLLYTFFSVISKCSLLYYAFFIMDENSNKESYLFFLALPVIIISIYGNIYTFISLNRMQTWENNKIKKITYEFSEDFIFLVREGWSLVSSRVISNLFNPIVIYLTGYYYGNETVGVVGVYQKIITGMVSVLTPINDIMYPKLANLYAEKSQEYNHYFVMQVSIIVVMFLAFLMVFYFADTYFYSYFNLERSDLNILFFYFYSFVIITNLLNMAVVNVLVIKSKTKFISMISVASVVTATLAFLVMVLFFSMNYIAVALAYVFQQTISLLLVLFYYFSRKCK
tara:strand:+ start:9106 stop:10353 length:1248 start_codon:yes stop_codon:yes gene_type:complete